MSEVNTYVIEKIQEEEQILEFLRTSDEEFIPVLSRRIDIKNYAKKLSEYAQVYGLILNEEICGMCAIYLNNRVEGFITSFNIMQKFQNQGYGKLLMQYVINEAKKQNYKVFALKVDKDNHNAIAFYKKNSFKEAGKNENWIELKLAL